MGDSVRSLTDEEFWKVMRAELGFHRSLLLIGWCTVWTLTGAPTMPEIEFEDRGASRAAAYRALRDLKSVAVAVARAEGRDVVKVERITLVEAARRIDELAVSRRRRRAAAVPSEGVVTPSESPTGWIGDASESAMDCTVGGRK